MKIYNTLSGKKEEFIPIEKGKVKMYVCGPTVYNFIHIGNARPMVFFDTVRRYLEYKGYEVNFVSNYTDIDDKIIKAANDEEVDCSVISERYIIECKKDAEGLNVRKASTHPRATEEIPEMIEMIETLIEKGHAYAAEDGTVYFKTRSFKEYGKLSHKNLEELQEGHRQLLVAGESKEDPLDFVLWKPKKEGEPGWDSPWCCGRPGWHIECSCMAKKYLGSEIDIHGGGEDLIFPHHENEIAQSEAGNGVTFARYWMHNAFLNIDNKKMSKSLGNFFTVRDISKKYDLNILRFFMLGAHYRSPINFSDTLMEAAKSGWERINNAYIALQECSPRDNGIPDDAPQRIKEIISDFNNAMDNDFNTADAIASIFDLVRFINTALRNGLSDSSCEALKNTLVELCDVLGIRLILPNDDLDEKIRELIDKRQAARKNKDFQEADRIRDELLDMGIMLKDTREGVKWSRV